MGILEGRAGLVTGGGSGIGRATALGIAREGGRVAVADIDAASAESVAAEIRAKGGEAFAMRTDVREEKQVEELVAAVVDRYGRLDWACNNAFAPSRIVPLHQMTRDDWDAFLEVGLVGVWLGLKYEVTAMLTSGGGAVVNVGSMVGVNGAPLMSAYAASKGGVIALSKSAAAEYAPMGIRVNVVNPGMIATPAVLAASDIVPDFHQRGIDAHALGRMGEPEEVAATIAFFLSEGAGFITGECIAIDGGVQVKATTYP